MEKRSVQSSRPGVSKNQDSQPILEDIRDGMPFRLVGEDGIFKNPDLCPIQSL
jgi:hypothetical protein